MHTFVSKLRFVLTLIVASMMILAGCGGGNSTPTNSTAPPPVLQVVTFTLIPARVVRSALCEDEITGLGGCVGINQQAEMPRIIAQNQQAPTDPAVIPFTRRTGSSCDVLTAQATGTLYEIDNHSFAQTKTGSAEIGIHVNAIDLSTAIPATSVNPLYQFTTTPPAQGETDRRIMPWRDTVVRDIELSFELSVKTMQRANALGYAQSHPVIELIDTKAGAIFTSPLRRRRCCHCPLHRRRIFMRKISASAMRLSQPSFATIQDLACALPARRFHVTRSTIRTHARRSLPLSAFGFAGRILRSSLPRRAHWIPCCRPILPITQSIISVSTMKSTATRRSD